jgi:tetratricopeptide (TPR) repeat protein
MATREATYTLRQRLTAAGRDLLEANPALPLALPALAVFLVLAGSDVGYYPTDWYPAALFVVGLLAVGLLAIGARIDAPRTAVLAVALLGAYAAWCYLSISWAENKGVAWDGANRAALYAAVLALFSLWRFDARGARAVLALLGLGVAAIGLVELLQAAAADDPGPYFIDARFSHPAGYINANVALWTLGAFPCLMLAATREAHPLLRALALAGAGLLASLALLGQSRGWVLALPLALLAYLVVSPRRVRTLVPVVLVAAGTLAATGAILDVHDGSGDLATRVSQAADDIVLVTVVLFLAGLTLAIADGAARPAARTVRTVNAAVGGLVALAVVVALAAVAIEVDSPLGKASDAWGEFKSGEGHAEQGTSRFTSGGTNRYDFWTVSVDLVGERPLEGIGSENFQEEYLRRGTSGEMPRFPHSLELGVLSQTGIVGLLLFLAALGAAAVAAARATWTRRVPEAAAAVAAAATFLYWLLHASVDWFWELPALTGPAVALLGLAGALGARSPRPAPAIVPKLGVAALAVVAVSLAAPWLSALEADRAARSWHSGLGAAYERLDRARALNPLSAQPDLVGGTIALRADDPAEAKRRFAAALERQPRIAYALLQLGVIAAEQGRQDAAVRLLRRAVRENPMSDVARDILAAVRRGDSVSSLEVSRMILDQARSRVE